MERNYYKFKIYTLLRNKYNNYINSLGLTILRNKKNERKYKFITTRGV